MKSNAFYSSADNEIIVCYELITEYFFTRYDILDLKDSLYNFSNKVESSKDEFILLFITLK